MAETNSAPTNGTGRIVELIRQGRARTRADLLRETGFARATVRQRLEALLDAGLVVPDVERPSTGGRPSETFAFNRAAGVLLVADIGASQARIALTDLAAGVLAERFGDIAIADGPDAVLGWVRERFAELLSQVGCGPESVRGLGLGVPGPVEFGSGRTVSPPIMTGWDGFPIPSYFAEAYGCPVVVDNDVNIMALGEHRACWSESPHLFMIKAGTGIGSAIVTDGVVYRGAQGAAGDLGHIRIAEDAVALCRCGNVGCVEAVAGGWALARDLSELGVEVANTRQVVALVRDGKPEAVRLLRAAARVLGEAVADAVSLLNPSIVVVGGDLAQAHEQLLAGIREVVYSRSLPLATRYLRIVRSGLHERAGVLGAAELVLQELFSPAAVERALREAR
ncbi:MAG: ROK family transcriptional regulator [Euzebyales bacterium]|nr:ROK family transcriptional regulator [Euzebyales bacterium]